MLKKHRKLLSVLLATVMICSSLSPMVFAVENVGQNIETFCVQEIFENDGVVSYFEQTAEWTLNAVLQDDGMISIAKTQKRQKGVVYTAICDGKELLKNEKAVYDVEMWELVCKKAESQMVEEQVGSFKTSGLNNQSQTRTNTAGVLLQQLTSIYGEEYSLRFRTKVYSNVDVEIYESLVYEMYPVGEEVDIPGRTTILAAASMLDISASFLGTVVGEMVTGSLPRGETFYRYMGVAFFYRHGKIRGTTYYIADKEMFHAGLDCVSNPNYEPLLDTQVYQIVYNDQTAFENDFVLAERARNAYAN